MSFGFPHFSARLYRQLCFVIYPKPEIAMKNSTRILHILSQQPNLTGSGVYLDAVIRLANKASFEQCAVVGVPAGGREISLGGLPAQAVNPLFFRADEGSPPGQSPGTGDLDFPIPGMSDVMPYPSTIWSAMSQNQLGDYRKVWRRHLAQVIGKFRPHLIHSNHLWLVTSLLKDLAGPIPVVATCHATGLRQMALCPHLAEEVSFGCSRLDHICVLHQNHQNEVMANLGVQPERISVTGVGFRDEIFHMGMMATEDHNRPNNILYVGKYSHAKGLPWLLDAFGSLNNKYPQLHLHIAGDGAGPEAEQLRSRMESMVTCITMHGNLDQLSLAQLMGRCAITVLPSFYEGVPLVLAEAAACGCKIVATELPGVTEQLAPVLGKWLHLVPLPRLESVDKPMPEDLPLFVQNLKSSLHSAWDEEEVSAYNLAPLTWQKVFQRMEIIWAQVM